MANTSSIKCSACGAQGSGKFCAECGAALSGATCRGCGGALNAGARFCHHCGMGISGAEGAAGAAARSDRSLLPWVLVAAAVLAVVIMVAAQRDATPAPATTPMGGAGPFAGTGVVQGPDISSMTPRERADRLYDRVMRLASEGKTDSASFFATMAVGAYSELQPLDADLRYDYGRMAEMANDLTLAQAQADAILANAPNHLLGLLLSYRVAERQNNSAAKSATLTKLRSAQAAEFGKKLEEYERHRSEIEAAIAGGASKTP